MSKRIFVIGFDLPGEEFEYIPFESDQSLLDADIILFEPQLGNYSSHESYNGKPLLGDLGSARLPGHIKHWNSEIISAVNTGKLVIIYLSKPVIYYRYTGEKSYSGTGRSRVTTNMVAEISSYAAVPHVSSVESKSGRVVKLTPDASFLAPYWREFGDLSPYEVFVNGKFTEILLSTKTGDKTVGAWVRGKGALLFLPPIRYDEEKFIAGKSGNWTAEAIKFGKRLVATLVALSNSLRKEKSRTPLPIWAQDGRWTTERESSLQADISSISSEIGALQSRRTDFLAQLEDARALRGLLYEQGPALEMAVREALELLEFSAKPFKSGDSEFDVIFESEEGRFLGEVEGKDSRPINIDKMSQLERNIQEDFAREGVIEYAKGVLFGNNERLTEPSGRGAPFTEKCLTAAKRLGIALIRTADLFEPARYLRENPDPEYASFCRKAIFETAGDIVVFPVPPVSVVMRISES